MKFIRLLLIFILFTYVSFEVNAKTYYVEKNGNDSNSGTSVSKAFKTLNKAFLVIESGDEILIGEGIFTLNRTLEWEGGITIKGAGSEKTIVQAAETAIVNKESVFSFSVFYNQKPYNCNGSIPESLIQDICIRYGAAPINEAMPTCVGGGIKNFAKLIVRNCIIENNTALNGGAIYNDGILVLENTQILNNHAFNLEGAIFNTSNAVYNEENCSFSSNTQD
jgi:predicted outer membrane repeat protein